MERGGSDDKASEDAAAAHPANVAPKPEPPNVLGDAESAGSGPSDGQLVQRVVGGDRTAFDELIRRYQRQAVAVSYRLLGSSHDALEVTQDAFLKAFTSLESLQKPGAFG